MRSRPALPRTRFARAHATGSDWRSLGDVLLEQRADRPDGRLAFIYADHSLAGDGDRILDYLRSHTGIPHWVGTVGLGLCSTGRETYEEAAAAVLVTDWDEDDFRVLPSIDQDPAAALASNADWRTRTLATFAVTHGDPGNAHTPELIAALANGLEGGYLVGGLTSSGSYYYQLAAAISEGPLSGVGFSAPVPGVSGLGRGCAPHGAGASLPPRRAGRCPLWNERRSDMRHLHAVGAAHHQTNRFNRQL